MDKLARLEAEADRRGAALADAASRFAHRFNPLALADEALGRLGTASEIVARAARVSRRYPLAASVFALSAAFLTWQYLHTTGSLVTTRSRKSLASRRPVRSAGRKLPPPAILNPTEGADL